MAAPPRLPGPAVRKSRATPTYTLGFAEPATPLVARPTGRQPRSHDPQGVFLMRSIRAVVLALSASFGAVAAADAPPLPASSPASLSASLSASLPASLPASPPKVLRYAMKVAETGFDPAQISDLYSSTLCANVFEALYQYEFLARPVRLRPNTAAAMPEIADDYKTFTIRVKPGIYFADDPAFKGRRRELVAADYVYSIKRHFDPRWKSPRLNGLENSRILGLDDVRQDALKSKKPFDYDREVEGLRTLDRYTLRIKLGQSNPRFLDDLSDPAVTGAVAREVVEHYGDRIMEHPVGTGPFKLGTWRRSSLIAFDRNPGYREVF
jgi:ABC-type transport system substrate-binding protein